MPAHKYPKTWTRAFALEPSKLIRIHDILLERLQRSGQKAQFKYSTEQKNGPAVSHASLADVTSLDNTQRQPIEALRMGGWRAEHSSASLDCTIVFRST